MDSVWGLPVLHSPAVPVDNAFSVGPTHAVSYAAATGIVTRPEVELERPTVGELPAEATTTVHRAKEASTWASRESTDAGAVDYDHHHLAAPWQEASGTVLGLPAEVHLHRAAVYDTVPGQGQAHPRGVRHTEPPFHGPGSSRRGTARGKVILQDLQGYRQTEGQQAPFAAIPEVDLVSEASQQSAKPAASGDEDAQIEMHSAAEESSESDSDDDWQTPLIIDEGMDTTHAETSRRRSATKAFRVHQEHRMQ